MAASAAASACKWLPEQVAASGCTWLHQVAASVCEWLPEQVSDSIKDSFEKSFNQALFVEMASAEHTYEST